MREEVTRWVINGLFVVGVLVLLKLGLESL